MSYARKRRIDYIVAFSVCQASKINFLAKFL